MITKQSWKSFRESGLLWWVNTFLHTFGWAICIEIQDEKIVDAYPARVKFRGFDNQINSEGYIKVSKYMADNAPTLYEESKE